jgi:ADP-ribose pyrophosphatase YjhB (NUDIX family)
MIRTRKWSDLWGIPGGKIKRGETSEDALRREILEETNLEVEAVRFVLVQDCIDSPEFYRPAHFVLLNYTCRCVEGREVRLNEEAQAFRWVSVDEAFALPLNKPTRVLLEAVAEARAVAARPSR